MAKLGAIKRPLFVIFSIMQDKVTMLGGALVWSIIRICFVNNIIKRLYLFVSCLANKVKNTSGL